MSPLDVLGSLHLCVGKDVGPPVWRLPKVRIDRRLANGYRGIQLGWRYTAYSVVWVWRPACAGGADQ